MGLHKKEGRPARPNLLILGPAPLSTAPRPIKHEAAVVLRKAQFLPATLFDLRR